MSHCPTAPSHQRYPPALTGLAGVIGGAVADRKPSKSDRPVLNKVLTRE